MEHVGEGLLEGRYKEAADEEEGEADFFLWAFLDVLTPVVRAFGLAFGFENFEPVLLSLFVVFGMTTACLIGITVIV